MVLLWTAHQPMVHCDRACTVVVVVLHATPRNKNCNGVCALQIWVRPPPAAT